MTAGSSVRTSIDIDRAGADVFALVSNFPDNTKWQRGQRSATWTSEPPLRVGSTYDQVASFLGRDVVNSFEVVDLEPGRRVRLTSTAGTLPITVTRTVDELGPSRARFTEEVEGDPRGVFRLADPILRRMLQRSIRRDLRRLKALLEGRPPP